MRVVVKMINLTNIQSYHSAMIQAKIMLESGIIDENDIVSIENRLAQKYGLNFGSLFRENDLINLEYRANILHTKVVI